MLTNETTQSTQRTVSNKAVISEIYEAFQAGNYDALDKYIANNVTEHTPDPLMKGTGLSYVKDMFKAYKTAFPDLRITVKEIVSENDKIAAYISMTGTNTGTIMGKPATNKKMSIEGFDLLKLNDGKVTDHWGVWDNMALMSQLGLSPDMSAGK